jgi:hypothetical protein
MATPNSLSRQRCANHAQREAVARCPECKRHFCRECITEHSGKLLCNHCLEKVSIKRAKKRDRIKTVACFLCCIVGFLIALGFFYAVANTIASIPQKYHRSYLGL